MDILPDHITDIKTRPATEDDAHLPAFDNTALVAMNTCPVWGSVTYGIRKKMPNKSREMALEAGAACHEVFAAARLWNLHQRGLIDHFDHHGKRLFGETRFTQMREVLAKFEDEDERVQILNFCLEALFTCGFYDDPFDKRRTLSNLEEACIIYLDRVRWNRSVYVENTDDPTSFIGIEIPFDIVVEASHNDELLLTVRFIGRVDGLHYAAVDSEVLELEENKTASRLDDAWSQSFLMSHQVTGYMVALTTMLEQHINRGVVHGLAIPQPRSLDINGIARVPVQRSALQFGEWFYWFVDTAAKYMKYHGNEVNAPRYTHSCNRYFRPCSLIPLCYGDDEDRALTVDQMVDNTWNPLDDGSSE